PHIVAQVDGTCQQQNASPRADPQSRRPPRPWVRLADAAGCGSAPSLTTGFMNYFNYFTEIETRFQQRRGSILMLSTLDWALIETWREAGVPLEAVLRGIDDAFDKRDAQKPRAGARRQRQVNGLAWCAQAVLEATEQFREASVGTGTAVPARESGFEAGRIARYLASNAALLDT